MNITLKTNANEIRMGIASASRSALNSSLHNAALGVRQDLRAMLDNLLKRSPEYEALTSGKLRGDLGLTDVETRIDQVLKVLKDSVGVNAIPVKTFGNEFRGGLAINMLRSGFVDILSLPAATVQGENFNVPWLEWLLTAGDRILVAGYHVRYELSPADRRASMSGVAIMAKGGGWRIPPQYAGTVNENWLTRTFNFDLIKNTVNGIVERNIKANLK